MRYRLFLLFIACAMASGAVGQSSGPGENFVVEGEVAGRDTGVVMLWSVGPDNLMNIDTGVLKAGKFRFSGVVNRACEAILWTDTSVKIYDDPSMVRFLLEPGRTTILYKVADPLKPVVRGGKVQQEKVRWDEERAKLLSIRRNGWDSMRILYPASKGNDSLVVQKVIDRVLKMGDSVNRIIHNMDVGYIKGHPNSYLSAYLLSQQQRRLPVDSIEAYYGTLASDVRKSRLGLDVLEYVYPLTDDNEFRKANPLIDKELETQLDTVQSVYALHLTDTSGRMVELSAFRNKYLVIDFWASWCGPCIANVPYLNKLIKSYSGDSIGFVSISLDLHLKDWKKALSDHGIDGVQLCDPDSFNGLAAIYCKTIYVPHYVIADREGRIINYDAPQAIEPALKKLLDGLLNGVRRGE